MVEHKGQLKDPQMKKQLGLCGGVDSYLDLATRQSIKATAHALGFKLVGEERGVGANLDVQAMKDGYRPDFYRLNPAQVFTPESVQKDINPAVEQKSSMGKLESDM